MVVEDLEQNEFLFQTGQEIRTLIAGGMEMGMPGTCVSAVKQIRGSQSEKFKQEGRVSLKEFGGFWSDLSKNFVGPLSEYSNRDLKKMVLPVMVPRGIGLPELPESRPANLVVLSAGNWHGVILCSIVHEQPIMLGNYDAARNGDVVGHISRTNLHDILLIDVVSLLKREGFLTVFK